MTLTTVRYVPKHRCFTLTQKKIVGYSKRVILREPKLIIDSRGPAIRGKLEAWKGEAVSNSSVWPIWEPIDYDYQAYAWAWGNTICPTTDGTSWFSSDEGATVTAEKFDGLVHCSARLGRHHYLLFDPTNPKFREFCSEEEAE